MTGQAEQKKPSVGVVLGSSSDVDRVKGLLDTLTQMKIGFEVAIISAHRTPDLVKKYARTAKARGIKVIIACAGLSAALPGALAAETVIPVLGVPLNAGSLSGVDALFSIAQMPPGVPVATFGVDASKNAALFAARILAMEDEELYQRLLSYSKSLSEDVMAKAKDLKSEGFPVWDPEATYMENESI